MMQAAMQAAMQEAAAREAGGAASAPAPADHDRGNQHGAMDMDSSNASLGIDAEQLGFLKALQAAEQSGDQSGYLEEMHMMGLAGNASDENMQSLLHMLAQQEQENSRPDEHYLTIAQNGEYNLEKKKVKFTF